MVVYTNNKPFRITSRQRAPKGSPLAGRKNERWPQGDYRVPEQVMHAARELLVSYTLVRMRMRLCYVLGQRLAVRSWRCAVSGYTPRRRPSSPSLPCPCECPQVSRSQRFSHLPHCLLPQQWASVIPILRSPSCITCVCCMHGIQLVPKRVQIRLDHRSQVVPCVINQQSTARPGAQPPGTRATSRQGIPSTQQLPHLPH